MKKNEFEIYFGFDLKPLFEAGILRVSYVYKCLLFGYKGEFVAKDFTLFPNEDFLTIGTTTGSKPNQTTTNQGMDYVINIFRYDL